MKNILIACIIFSGILLSCGTEGNVESSHDNQPDVKDPELIAKVEVYYFHAKHRCPTCIAIEEVAKSTIDKYFSKELEEKDIVFIKINLSEEGHDDLIEKFEITSSSLVLRAFNDSGEIITDLTESGFLNARSEPEKLEQEIKESIENLLK